MIFLAATFTLAGGAAFHLIVGHATFLPYFYLPWMLFFFLAALEAGALRHTAGAAATIALGIYAGGTHVVFMGAVGLGFFALAMSALRRDWRPMALLAATGVLAALFAAPKLIPLLRFVTTPDLVDIRYFLPEPDRITPAMLQHLFTDAHQYPRLRFPGQLYGWQEYANYLGPLGPLLIVASFVWMLIDRRSRCADAIGISLAITALILFVLMLGEFASYAPYNLLRRLPLMSQFRLPSRYTLVLTLFAVAVAASAFGGMTADRSPDRRLQRFAGVVLILAVCDLAVLEPRPLRGIVHDAAAGRIFQAAGVSTRTGNRRADRRLRRRFADAARDDGAQRGGIEVQRAAPVARRGSTRRADRLRRGHRSRIGDSIPAEPDQVCGAGARRRSRVRESALRQWLAGQRRGARNRSGIEAPLRARAGRIATRIELSFSPPGLVSGLILFLIGLAASAAIWRRTLAPAPANRLPAPGAWQSRSLQTPSKRRCEPASPSFSPSSR